MSDKCHACGGFTDEKNIDGTYYQVCLRCKYKRELLPCELRDVTRKDINGQTDPEKDPEPEISYSIKGGGEYHLSHLTDAEVDALDAALIGAKWVRMYNGRLQVSDAYEKPPAPEVDPASADEWQPHRPGRLPVSFNYEYKRFGKGGCDAGGSILIHSLCGYYYSKEYYSKLAQMLASYGFSCCRSTRNDRGRYNEVWYLPYLGAADGDLKNHLLAKCGDRFWAGNDKKSMDVAVSFLSNNVAFGSLDVVAQRLAMGAE